MLIHSAAFRELRLICRHKTLFAEIIRSGRICHGWSSFTLWQQAGSVANLARVINERVRGLLVERRRPPKAVALLELSKCPLRLWANHAIERTIIAAHIAKLQLCPPDVVFREVGRIYPMVGRRGRFSGAIRDVISGCRKIQSGATNRQCQYRSCAEEEPSKHNHLPFTVNYQIGIQNSFATTRVLAQCVKFWTRETRCNGYLSLVAATATFALNAAVLLPCLLHVLLPRHLRFLGAGFHLSYLSQFRGPAQTSRNKVLPAHRAASPWTVRARVQTIEYRQRGGRFTVASHLPQADTHVRFRLGSKPASVMPRPVCAGSPQ